MVTTKGKAMGMFDGIDKVSSSSGGAWLLPGKHRFMINALKSPEGLRNGQCFIAELSIVTSTNAAYVEGQSVSWIRNVTKHREMALADIKGFLAAAANCDEATIGNAEAQEAVSEDQPFAGVTVDCEAFNRPTKSGGEFTRTLWTAVE